MFRRLGLNLSICVTAGALLLAPATASSAAPAHISAPSNTDAAKITTKHWSSLLGFLSGHWSGLIPTIGGGLALKPFGSLPTTTYTDPFGDGTAKTYEYGSWTSPVVQTGYPIDESISSWNARTPTGTYVETTFRGRLADGSWTKWYVMGRWTSGNNFAAGDIHRTSLDGQGDANATVYTDTFSAKTGHQPVAYQSKVTLLRPKGRHTSPTLDGLTTMTNAPLADYSGVTSTFTLGKQVELAVPPYAQNIHAGEYPEFGGGGEVWCSPTSTAMVQSYWGKGHQIPPGELAKINAPNGDPQVDYAAMNTWDYTYDGSGNWPFNAAYAHPFGLDTFVTRLRSLAEVEQFIKAGIPVITALSFTAAELPGAGYSTDGHLMVIVGFTSGGDPILNDPASNSDANVRTIYPRKNFEQVWQKSAGGVVYIYHPHHVPLPRNLPGVTRNW